MTNWVLRCLFKTLKRKSEMVYENIGVINQVSALYYLLDPYEIHGATLTNVLVRSLAVVPAGE